MRRLTIAGLLCLLVCQSQAQQGEVIARNPEVITGRLIRTTKPLRDMTPADKLIPAVPVRDMEGIIGRDEAFEEGEGAPNYGSRINRDEALQTVYPNNPHANANRAVTHNFDGINFQPVTPPDPTMCVGPNHIIQMVNGVSGAVLKIFNKSGGTLRAEADLDAITGKGGLGDPIAMYDHLADRFVLLEFNNSGETVSEGLTIAVSQTPDPMGSWYVYFFSRGSTFPDYPKLSVWPDAYYATTNDFTASYDGTSYYAFDRTKMLAGDPLATVQRITIGSLSKHFASCVVTLEGNTLPPAGTGGLFAYMQDDSWTGPIDADSIGLYEFDVDFVTPANTVVTTRASLNVAAFKSDICGLTRGRCISQPSTSIMLEALQQKVMNQPIYRRFGTYEGIVMSHIVDKGSNISGVRWYELRKTTGNWSVYQQSTYAPDNTHRWMPAICYDNMGNIALAYNVSSNSTGVYPGIRYTGRKECDAPNTMTYSEDVLRAGTNYNSNNRYGDYSHMQIDPDGVTFWVTCEYNIANTWSTRIASFTLDPCTPPACAAPSVLSTSNITTSSATLNWSAASGATSYDVEYKESSSATWIPAVTGTTNLSFNLSGLSENTSYDWHVRSNCGGPTSSYTQTNFTTLSSCNAPTNLNASSITTSSATVSWTAASGANTYTVEYKRNVDAVYAVLAATASTSQNLTSLQANTLYDYRVKSNCNSGSSAYANGQFTTLASGGCPDILEPNNNQNSAPLINTGVNYNALIANSTDVDYYSFNNTSAMKRIKITMNNLPANYDIRLLKPNNNQVAGQSTNTGTTPETIIYNASKNNQVGTYKVHVYGVGGAFSSTQCYTLLVQLSANNWGPEGAPDDDGSEESGVEVVKQGALKVYPVPAKGTVNISFDASVKGSAEVTIINEGGSVVLTKKLGISKGINFGTLDISRLPAGVYTVKVKQDNVVQVQKMIIGK